MTTLLTRSQFEAEAREGRRVGTYEEYMEGFLDYDWSDELREERYEAEQERIRDHFENSFA